MDFCLRTRRFHPAGSRHFRWMPRDQTDRRLRLVAGAHPDGDSHGRVAAGHHRRPPHGLHHGRLRHHGVPCGGLHFLVATTGSGPAALPQPGLCYRDRRPGTVGRTQRARGERAPAETWLFRSRHEVGRQLRGARPRGGPWPHFNVDGVWVSERTTDYEGRARIGWPPSRFALPNRHNGGHPPAQAGSPGVG